MLTVSTAAEQLFHTNPGTGVAELCLKSNLEQRSTSPHLPNISPKRFQDG